MTPQTWLSGGDTFANAPHADISLPLNAKGKGVEG